MAGQISIAEAVAEIRQSVIATPSRQRRLLSKTFWKKLGIERRSDALIAEVKAALKNYSLLLNLEEERFGKERKDEWLVLSYVEPPFESQEQQDQNLPLPPESWFKTMAHREFESEAEVEYYFVMPLLEALGYREEDLAIRYPVEMFEGVHKVKKQADVVAFEGRGRDKRAALVLAEVKNSGRPLTSDAVGQARGYAFWLTTPLYMVTNGDEVQLHVLHGGVQPDAQLLTFRRHELQRHWEGLCKYLAKGSVIQRKRGMETIFAKLGKQDAGKD